MIGLDAEIVSMDMLTKACLAKITLDASAARLLSTSIPMI